VDLDGFKHINDALGHPFGDRLLIAVARRFERSFRAHDVSARLGGDEFAAVLRGVSSENASRIAREIAETLEAPFQLDGRQVTITASIGVASLAARPASTEVDLMGLAEVAMYAAKRRHCRVVAYENGLRTAINGRPTSPDWARCSRELSVASSCLSTSLAACLRRQGRRVRGSAPLEPSVSRHPGSRRVLATGRACRSHS